MENSNFKFNISLSVLNHLGRNLYRSFATVLGEAISNSWDANSKNVWITIDRENDRFWIKDDGIGMDAADFGEKFLKIGYSKRREGGMLSPDPFRRPYIGNKGIGKLALLSCAKKITISSKKIGAEDYVGGMIDNSSLDAAIVDDLSSHDYFLSDVNESLFVNAKQNHAHGTIICFEELKDDFRQSDDFLKKIIALYFRFSLLDPQFNIYINNTLVTIEALTELAQKTQFIWNINNWSGDAYIALCTNVKETINKEMAGQVSGFIASTKKPNDRNIHSTGEKVGVDLFVNGRVRETNILKHIPSSQVPESYLYGQIHFDTLDRQGRDPFISSREGVLTDDELYKEFIMNLRTTILSIIDEWDLLRDRYDEDGDPENTSRENSRTKKTKAAYREALKSYSEHDTQNDLSRFLGTLKDDASFNTNSYIDCFIAENVLRRYIRTNSLVPSQCMNINATNGETCLSRGTKYKSQCAHCRTQSDIPDFQQLKRDAQLSIQVRRREDDMLEYLEYIDLAKIINQRRLHQQTSAYRPLRNSVMHVTLITEEAKTKLRSLHDEIVAFIRGL